MQQFGLNFPLQTIDPQGGMLGPNAPTTPEVGSQSLGGTGAPTMAAPQAPQGTPPAAPSAAAATTPSPPASSPLGSPLAPGGAGLSGQPTPDSGPTAPAAGVGSPLGKVQP